MPKYLFSFEKGESVRWLGHLDILRTFERAIRRETGMSMSQYRTRYALRARRPMWRVEPDGRADGGLNKSHGRRPSVQRVR